jgi:hypothetical protein
MAVASDKTSDNWTSVADGFIRENMGNWRRKEIAARGSQWRQESSRLINPIY